MSSAPPEELQRKLPHNPPLWAANYLRHPNDPSRAYDFYDDTKQNKLWYLTDSDGPMNPSEWGDINVLLFARGSLKTWTTTTIAGWGLDIFPSLEVVATAPVDDQRGEVIDRFKEKAEQSGLADRRVKDNMGHQKFKNKTLDPETGEYHTSYSHLKSRSAWDEGNKLRGLHAHVGIIDEAQDVDEGTFSTFLEAIDRELPQVPYFPTIFVIGTPKMANTFFHKLWEMSDKRTWDADAKAPERSDRDSGRWIKQSESQEFLPEELQSKKEDLQDKIQNLKEERYTAAERGNGQRVEELSDLIEEFEERLGEIEGFTVRGWHIDQHNSPLHKDRNIAFKRETYSKRKFENEVKAKFYSPENDLITKDDLWETAFVDTGFRSEPRYSDTRNYLGVDWGGGKGEGAGKTVLIAAEEAPNGDIEVLNVAILSSSLTHSEERDKIDNWMQRYDVDIAVVDEGHGDTDREILQDEFGYDDSGAHRLYGCWYGNVSDKEEVKWNRFESQRRYFTAYKTFMVEHMVEDLKEGKIRIPKEDLSFDGRQSNGTVLVDQLTAPYTEKKTTESGKTKKSVVADRNDDAFDALTYVWIAANKITIRRVKEIRSHKRPGYN